MDYKNKYLKYKRKYLLLKGGAEFVQGDESIHSDTEDIQQDEDISKEILLYQKWLIDPGAIHTRKLPQILKFSKFVSSHHLLHNNIDVIKKNIKSFINNIIKSKLIQDIKTNIDNFLVTYKLIKQFASEYIVDLIPNMNAAITSTLHKRIPSDITFIFSSLLNEKLIQSQHISTRREIINYEISSNYTVAFELGESVSIKDDSKEPSKLIIILTPKLLKRIIDIWKRNGV